MAGPGPRQGVGLETWSQVGSPAGFCPTAFESGLSPKTKKALDEGAVALIAEWRTKGEFEAILIVDDEDNTVREALAADPAVLSSFLTDMGDLNTWRGGHSVDDDKRSPEAWGDLVIARANTGEVITMDPERYWEGIYTWFRSRGVDYDTPPQ